MYLSHVKKIGCTSNCIECDEDNCKTCGQDYKLDNGICSKLWSSYIPYLGTTLSPPLPLSLSQDVW